MIEFKLRESRNLDQALQEVSPKLERNILRSALREGGNLVRDAAKRGAPIKSGLLQRSIKTIIRVLHGEVTASVGIFTPSGKAKGKIYAFYAMWVELGHRIGTRTSRLKLSKTMTAGFVRGRPFLLPALYAKQGEVQRTVMEHIAQRLDEVV